MWSDQSKSEWVNKDKLDKAGLAYIKGLPRKLGDIEWDEKNFIPSRVLSLANHESSYVVRIYQKHKYNAIKEGMTHSRTSLTTVRVSWQSAMPSFPLHRL